MPRSKLPVAQDQHDRRLLQAVKKDGYHITAVFTTKASQGPHFAYTTGLFYTYGVPEIFVSEFNCMFAAEYIKWLAEAIKTGEKFSANQMVDVTFGAIPMAMVKMYPRYVRARMMRTMWFYQGKLVPVLQCIISDRNMCFPWDAGYLKSNSDMQKLYGRWKKPSK